MAAASSYSSDVLQESYEPRRDETIQNLPPKIREKIQKELVAKKK